jgi:hypothetical protein
MISLEGTDESSLSDGTAKLIIRTVIGQFPLLKSIFRLLKEICRYFKDHDAKIRTKFLALSAFVRKCPQMSANVRFFSHLLLFM